MSKSTTWLHGKKGPRPLPTAPTAERLSIRATYERFPASLKGAFILRSVDGDPHLVEMKDAVAREVSDSVAFDIGLKPITIDVAPLRDVFVPFEFATGELSSGWYQLECDVSIDGFDDTPAVGEKFRVAWSRGSVRKGTVKIGTALVTKKTKVQLERLEMEADKATLWYSADVPANLKVDAGDQPLAILAQDHDSDSSSGRTTFYPVLKNHAALRVAMAGAEPVEIKLPG